MLIAALFTIANKHVKAISVSMDEWIKNIYVYVCVCVYIHICNGLSLNHTKNETFPFATTDMELEGPMLSEISHRRTNTAWFH